MPKWPVEFISFRRTRDTTDERYTLLDESSSSNSTLHSEHNEHGSSTTQLSKPPYSKPNSTRYTLTLPSLQTLSLTLALLSTLLNIFLFLSSISRPSFSHSPPSSRFVPSPYPHPTQLTRANQFLGLERVNYSSSSYTFHNHSGGSNNGDLTKVEYWPTILGVVDSRRALEVMTNENSAEMREFITSNEASTIIQFRTRDYGMERCALRLTFPHPSSSTGTTASSNKNKKWSLSGDVSDLEIWSLAPAPKDQHHEWINVSRLTHRTKPLRTHHLSSLNLNTTSTSSSLETLPFPCPQESIHAFEIFCPSPRCLIRGLQRVGGGKVRKGEFGLSVVQYSSL